MKYLSVILCICLTMACRKELKEQNDDAIILHEGRNEISDDVNIDELLKYIHENQFTCLDTFYFKGRSYRVCSSD